MSEVKAHERTECDIREDADQEIKQQEIIDLLVAAGYFRARIKGLSSFDKIVGGIVWCMESCSYDVDVDILFQENSTIGQKIALTEKIVEVLPKMGCPHLVEPHQIQGLDFIHIYPVIQWLVKQSVHVRAERWDFLRQYAIRQFHGIYGDPNVETLKGVRQQYKSLQDHYCPKRIFRRKGSLPEDQNLLVRTTLMEYGYYVGSSDDNVTVKSLEDASDMRIPLKTMGNIISSQAEHLNTVTEQLSGLTVDVKPVANTVDLLKMQHNALLEEKKCIEESINEDLKKHSEVKQALEALKTESSTLNENDKWTLKICGLVELDESLKKQESDFRNHCHEELSRLQNTLSDAEEKNIEKEQESLELKCEGEREQLQQLRLQAARKNRAVSLLQRQLDESPGRAELAQYQKRFLELYGLVAQKHAETKQFYALYNTLNDKKLYLTKEFNLLNSILDTYNEAMTNNHDKEMFIQQFEGIISSIKQNKAKVTAKRNEEREKKDKLSQQLQQLVEQQRAYVNVVQELRNECKKNELLLSQLKSMTNS